MNDDNRRLIEELRRLELLRDQVPWHDQKRRMELTQQIGDVALAICAPFAAQVRDRLLSGFIASKQFDEELDGL